MARRHLARRDIQALLDGELHGWRRLRLRHHVAGCDRCRDALEAASASDALAAGMLDTLPRPMDLDESWERLTVRSGGRALRPRGPRGVPWYVVGAGSGLAATAVLALVAAPGSPPRRALDLSPPEKAPTADDRRFVSRLHGLLADGEAQLIEDRCCADRDGEGPADDGAVLIQVRRSPTPIVVMYEDRDGSGSLTAGDIVRLVSRGEAPVPRPAPAGRS